MGLLAKGLCLAAVGAFWAFLTRDSFDPGSLAGAKVLLTGASAGIGEQMAYHYATFGAQIVLTARREDVLEKVMEKCLKLGARSVFYIAADMSLPPDTEKVVKFALEKLGGLDYLVLNHIGQSPFKLWAGEVNHTRWLMQVNFLSYVQLASAALPALTKSKGSIVVVSSLIGKIPTPYTTSYTAAKFALDGFFGSLRHELAMVGTDVSITLCILGVIDTEYAMEKIRGVVMMSPYPATEAALAIIKGGATRAREIHYPWGTMFLCLIRDWFPDYRDLVIRSFYNYSNTAV
ncbi:hydroxysteroid 11-beta-dehydrogenase 1-like protein [Ambystoma mexicanum]|uniref:hydroxysteroid 11-beta-dehydrogenase 1-like protein n=1 Tax=Ambystoma mexicanum TaxID=8296 RepID=UPI0037E7649A